MIENRKGCFSIELLGDMCVSNGKTLGSIIDIDVCYDDFGLPIIKGKSLKGCLREIAEELIEWNIIKNKDFVSKVFGEKGSNEDMNLYLSDAHIENSCLYKQAIKKEDLKQQDLIDAFTYCRTQTSIDENGIAKKNSLRTIRVVKKGEIFICKYCISEKNHDDFILCLKSLRNIGMNRTRGLGNIKINIKKEQNILNAIELNFEFNISKYNENEEIAFKFDIENISPLMISDGKELYEYIPGSNIIGMFIRILGEEKVVSAIKDGVIFKNANISLGDDVFYQIPAFFAKKKEAGFKKSEQNNSKEILETCILDLEGCDELALPIKKMLVSFNDEFSNLKSTNISKEISYHHQRSEDKSYGRAEGKNFYQLESISANNKFSARIIGKPKALHNLLNGLKENKTVYLGRYRTAGFGECVIKNFIIEDVVVNNKKTETNKIAVIFKSPALFYNQMGMPSVNKDAFSLYFNNIIKSDDISIKEISHVYLKTVTIGGYNYTWNMHKPKVQMFDSGTVFIIELDSKVDIQRYKNLSIGERITEGYGDICIVDYNKIKPKNSIEKKIKSFGNQNADINENIVNRIEKIKFKKRAEEYQKEAINVCKKIMNEECVNINSTQLGKIILMYKENSNYSDFKKNLEELKFIEKAKGIVDCIEKGKENIDSTENEFRNEYLEVAYKIYIDTLLTHLKYKIRQKKEM